MKKKLLNWSKPDSNGNARAGLFEIRVYQPTSAMPYPGFPDGKFVASFHVQGMRHELGVYNSRAKAYDACETYALKVLGR